MNGEILLRPFSSPDVLYKCSCTNDHVNQFCVSNYTVIVNMYTLTQQVSVICSWALRAFENLVTGLKFSSKRLSVSKNKVFLVHSRPAAPFGYSDEHVLIEC